MEARVTAGTEVRLPDTPEARAASFVISTAARDSHHTVLDQEKWDLTRYGRNPIVGWHHEVWGGGLCYAPDPDNTIGTSVVALEGAGRTARLVADATFEPREINELAEKVYRKVLFGSLRATSVGFYELGQGKWGDGDEAEGRENETYYFAGQELMEWSICHMGSNPETVRREATNRARSFLSRAVAGLHALGDDVTLEQVMRMTVADAITLLERQPQSAALLSTSRAERRQKTVDFIRSNL